MFKYLFAFSLVGLLSWFCADCLASESYFLGSISGFSVIVTICIFSDAFTDHGGQSLKLAELKKKVYYRVLGRGDYSRYGGDSAKKVIFVMKDSELATFARIYSVVLPADVDLPEKITGFYFIKHRNKLGKILKNVGELVIYSGDGTEQSITFNLR